MEYCTEFHRGNGLNLLVLLRVSLLQLRGKTILSVARNSCLNKQSMGYRKYKADFLFDGYGLHRNKTLIVDENGTIESVISNEESSDDVQLVQGILCPGFINCHCHLELSHLHGLIAEKTGLVDFVFEIVTKRNFEQKQILSAIAVAEQKMISNGIVAVGDICNNTLTWEQKQKGNLQYYTFIEVSGWLPQVAETRFKQAFEIYESFNHQSSIYNCIVPHAPYSVSQNLWQLVKPCFQNKTVSIHNQETHFEDELFIQGSGDFTRMYSMMKMDNGHFLPSKKSSLQTYFSKLGTARNVMLVHNTFTKEEDVLYAKQQAIEANQNLFWCLCINANLYIEAAVPPLDMLIKNDCNIVLGTDSLASNWSLNLLDEMKSLRTYFPSLTTEQLLRFATSNGAHALQMNEKLGSFEKGKQPGVLLLKEDLSEVKRLI